MAEKFEQNAIHALKLIGPAVVPQLVVALKDKEKESRRKAAIPLGEIGLDAKRAVTPLRELLKDPDPRVREAAAEALK